MARYTPSGTVSTIPAINSELEAISQAFEDTLSRLGDSPNQLEADLDANGNAILNVVTDPDNPNSLVSRNDIYIKEEVDSRDDETLAAAQAYVNQVANIQATEISVTDVLVVGTPPSGGVGTVVKTSGFTTQGDGGGDLWVKTSDTSTPSQYPLDMLSFTLTDVNGDVWRLVHNGEVNLSSLGLSPNDSTKDYGALINNIRNPATPNRASRVIIPEGRYHVATTIKRYAGTSLVGVNRAFSELYNVAKSINAFEPARISETDAEGNLIGNGSGTYYGSIEELTLSNFDIGLNGIEDWWLSVKNLNIVGCNIGQKTGFGSSDVTGNYWCRFEGIRYLDNDVNLLVTDFTNLNHWERCRFEGATNQDVYFLEPTNTLALGMENNKFSQCEFVSLGGIELAARILGLVFDQCYFENQGTAIYDDNNTKPVRSVIFNECGFYGGGSASNKVRLGYGTSFTTHVKADNCITNIGRGVGAPATLYVFDMGPNAFWWVFDNPYIQNGSGVEFVNPVETNKDKWQLRAENRTSIEFYDTTTTRKSLTQYHSVQDDTPQDGINIKAQVATIVKNVGTMPTDTSYVEVARIDRFFLAAAYSFANIKATFCGRNLDTPGPGNAYIEVDVSGNTTNLASETEVANRQYGTGFVFGYNLRKDGSDLVFEVRTGNGDDIDQASISTVISCNGGFIGTAEEV